MTAQLWKEKEGATGLSQGTYRGGGLAVLKGNVEWSRSSHPSSYMFLEHSPNATKSMWHSGDTVMSKIGLCAVLLEMQKGVSLHIHPGIRLHGKCVQLGTSRAQGDWTGLH